MAIATAHVTTTSPLHATACHKIPDYIKEFDRRFLDRTDDERHPVETENYQNDSSSLDSEEVNEDTGNNVTCLELKVNEEQQDDGCCPSRNPSFRSDKVPADTR